MEYFDETILLLSIGSQQQSDYTQGTLEPWRLWDGCPKEHRYRPI